MGIKIRNNSGGAVELEASPAITTDEKYYLAPMTDELKAHLANGGAMPDWNGVSYDDPLAVGTNKTAKIYPDGVIVGSTNYGSYTRRPDGHLEVEIINPNEYNTIDPYGTLFMTYVNGSPFLYSVRFITTPMTYFTVYGNNVYGTLGIHATANLNVADRLPDFRIINIIDSGVAKVKSISIGRWK